LRGHQSLFETHIGNAASTLSSTLAAGPPESGAFHGTRWQKKARRPSTPRGFRQPSACTPRGSEPLAVRFDSAVPAADNSGHAGAIPAKRGRQLVQGDLVALAPLHWKLGDIGRHTGVQVFSKAFRLLWFQDCLGSFISRDLPVELLEIRQVFYVNQDIPDF
jgi:hypothetical protein